MDAQHASSLTLWAPTYTPWTSTPTRWTATQPGWTRVVFQATHVDSHTCWMDAHMIARGGPTQRMDAHATHVDGQCRAAWVPTHRQLGGQNSRFGQPQRLATSSGWTATKMWPRWNVGHPRGRLGLLVDFHTFWPGHLWGYVANLTRLCGPNSWPRQVLWAVTCRRGQGLCWECGCARRVATRTLCVCTKRNVDARAHRMVARTFRVDVRGRDIVRRCVGPRVKEQSLTLSEREGYESDGSEKRGVLLP